MTQSASDGTQQRTLQPIVRLGVQANGTQVPAIWRFEVRTPTLPPATHTNVYMMGRGGLVVIDPASPYPEEREALKSAIAAHGDGVAAIFLTHQHLDHVSGATALKRATGAPIWAHEETAKRLTGRIPVDHLVRGGDRIPAGGLDVEAIFTPGHAPGHLCLLDHGSGTLVCGDMVASEGSILVDADDDGDMAIYLDELARMRTLNPTCLLPSHGPPIWNADAHLAGYIAHRQMREEKVRAALTTEPQSMDELVPHAYDDTPQQIWPLAKRAMKAHLIKLSREGVAVSDGDRWRRS